MAAGAWSSSWLARLGAQDGSRCGFSWPTGARCINRRFTSLCLFAYHPPSRPRALLMAEWMIAFVWGRARCRGQAHDCVICARQLFGDNTVLPHYESHTVNLTKSYSLGLGPGEGGCKGP